MRKGVKIILSFVAVVVIAIAIFIWILLGNPYYKPHLFGTDYIKNSESLSAFNQLQNSNYLLVKKYKYSQDAWVIGFGGGGSRSDDYYALGIANADEKVILPARYEFISVGQDAKTKMLYLECIPYRKSGLEPNEYYQIKDDKAILLKDRKY